MSVAEPVLPAPLPGSTAWWFDHVARLERRRPRADGLTIERIVDEAIDLMDDDGLDALTVRGLAARFQTGPATLYRHVASRDELLVLIVDHVLGEVQLPSTELPPRAQVEALAWGLRRVLLRHPHLLPVLPAAPLLGPNAVLGSERALSALLAGGFDVEAAVAGYLVLLDYVLGSVSFDSARLERHNGTDAGAPPPSTGSSPVLDATRHPVQALGSDGAFEFGLRTFLDGLEAGRSA